METKKKDNRWIYGIRQQRKDSTVAAVNYNVGITGKINIKYSFEKRKRHNERE